MVRTALTLAQRGRAVFPCRPFDKRPATANGCKDATTDFDTIREWWLREPRFNIAIATGAISGIWVIDVDGLDAEAELRKLERAHDELPATVEVITARGRHIYFKTPKTPIRNSTSKIGQGIDVRGDGGYVLAPPSVHPSGRRYTWSVDSADEFAAPPAWLLDKLRSAGHAKVKPPASQPTEWRSLMVDGVDEGQRDTAATRLCGYLLHHRVDPNVVLEFLQLWNSAHCRPPLPQKDIERIAASIAAKEIRRRYGRGGR
jgi:hypothetical protein